MATEIKTADMVSVDGGLPAERQHGGRKPLEKGSE